jgi:RNA polymerase primary sigma factor
MIIPARPDHTETAEVFSAVEALNSWWGNGRVMDGKRRREALAALEALDFSLPFYKELVRSVEEADASGELTSRLDTQIYAFEGSTDALIHVHLPYARRFAARNVEQGEDPEDVFQVAFMGLQRSTRRFDPERGARFVTYCTFWMKQALTRWRADEGSAIRVPVHRHGYLIKLDQAIDMLDVRADGSVSDRDLASELGWTPDEVRQFRQIPRQTEYPDETDAWDEVLPISDEENFFEQEETRKIISDALDELPERQADVIRKRFGIGQDQEMTLEEIGQLYGVTRERIRQIEATGLNQLSHPGRKRRLQTLLGM